MGRPVKGSAASTGEVIAGRFRIDAALGEGGMATVYRVLDLATKKPFALKLLKPEIADHDEAMARLQRECEVLTRLDNPAVVQLETFGKLPDGRIFMVMELLEGETLGDFMRREKRLDADDFAPIVAGAAAGLTAAHNAGVIHRDLKPDNVFLVRAENGPVQVKLLDFGISKVYSNEERLTRTGQVLGTPRYMAPEQLSAEDDLDARVDVYALGVIMYEALAGSPPFIAGTPSDLIIAILNGRATPLRSLRPDIPPELESVVQRAMARSRDARFRTPHELADAYLSVLGARAKAGARQGMRTQVVGSASTSVAPPPMADDGELRPGTFSELEKQNLPAPARSGPSGFVPSGVVPGPHLAASAGSHAVSPHPVPHAMSPQAAPPTGAAGGFAQSAVPVEPTAAATPTAIQQTSEPSEAIVLPARRNGLWFTLALLAGALTAGVATYFLQDDATTPTQPAIVAPVPYGAEHAEHHEHGDDDDGDHDEHDGDEHGDEAHHEAEHVLPVGAVPPPDLETPEETSMSSGSRRRRNGMRGMRGTGMEGSNSTDPPPPHIEPYVADMSSARPASEVAREATAALRGGDGARCLQILDELSPSRRPAYVMRLEGDCLLRIGRRDDAVKAYERICDTYPNSRGLDQLRQLVESLGGRCNLR